MDKEKEKNIKKLLKMWGDSNQWLNVKNNEYKDILSKYNKEKSQEQLTDKCLFTYKTMAEQVFESIRDYMAGKDLVDDAVESLDPIEKSIIIIRYIKKIKWEALPLHMPVSISLRQCHRIHKASLEKIADFLEKTS